MPAPITLRHAKRLSVSRSIWPLMSVGLFAMNPLCSALADVGKVEDSTLTLGTVNVQGTARGPLTTSSVLSSVDILGDRKSTRRTPVTLETRIPSSA